MGMIKALLLTALMLVPLLPVKAISEPSDEPFDYTRTMAIYHMVEGGGHIYVRPRGYHHLHGFIMIYESLDQYIVELANPENQSFMSPGSQPVLDEFVLVNDVSQKRYFLKKYWLGDGESWVPMSGADYDRLRRIIDGRHTLGSVSTPENGLEKHTKEIHERSTLNDYSGYEWEGENVSQDPIWTEAAGPTERESSATEGAETTEDQVDRRLDAPAQRVNLPKEEKATVGAAAPDRQREKPSATSTVREPQPTKEVLTLDEGENAGSGGTKEALKTEKSESGLWTWISTLFILLLGGFLYIRRKS